MELLKKADSELVNVFEKACGKRKRAVFIALLVYTGFFLLLFLRFFGTGLSERGYIIAGDGMCQYLPFLIDLRRSLLEFFDSIAKGSPVLPMTDFGFCYGSDRITGTAVDFIPLLPFYALSVFLPEEAMPQLLTAAVMLMSYASGIAFMILCSHFGKNIILSGLIAPFYVFCGNYMYTGWANPHFLYMYIAFPFIVVGLDRMINGKGFLLFSLSVTFMALCGGVLLLYTVPFAVVFAAVRVYYVHKGHYLINLGKYFLYGLAATLVGMAAAGIIVLPFAHDLLLSARSAGREALTLGELLIPKVSELEDMLAYEGTYTSVGACLAAVPCFLYMLVYPKAKNELRLYGLLALLCAGLPLIRYALNAFQYELCRWGFVPALVLCYGLAEYLPVMIKPKKRELITFAAVLGIYIVTLTLNIFTLGLILIVLWSIAAFFPAVTKALTALASKLWDKTSDLFKKAASGKGRFVVLLLAVMAGFALLGGIVVIIFGRFYTLLPLALLTVFLAAGIAVFGFLTDRKAFSGLAAAVFCVIVGVLYISDDAVYDYVDIDKDERALFSQLENSSHGSLDARYADIVNEYKDLAFAVSDDEAEQEAEDKADNGTEEENNAATDSGSTELSLPTEQLMNVSLEYDIPYLKAFKSTISGDYLGLLRRCGIEGHGIISPGEVMCFFGSEPLYSLFGAKNMFAAGDEARTALFGIEENGSVTTPGGKTYYLYTNNYAFPLGVTYDAIMSRERFESFSDAELPFAMMNEICIDVPANDRDAEYSVSLPFTIEQNERGTTKFGITCYDNTLTLDGDTSGCFLYVSFYDVVSATYPSKMCEPMNISCGDRLSSFLIPNLNSSWQWPYFNDHYVLPLGYQENDIDTISFISPFEFSSVTVTAVPKEIYTSAHEQRTAGILTDIETKGNTLTGKINVSSDKVLCVSLLYSDGWTAYIQGEHCIPRHTSESRRA